MNRKLIHFLLAWAASAAFIALLPANVVVDYGSHDFLFVVSSALVIYFIADGIKSDSWINFSKLMSLDF